MTNQESNSAQCACCAASYRSVILPFSNSFYKTEIDMKNRLTKKLRCLRVPVQADMIEPRHGSLWRQGQQELRPNQPGGERRRQSRKGRFGESHANGRWFAVSAQSDPRAGKSITDRFGLSDESRCFNWIQGVGARGRTGAHFMMCVGLRKSQAVQQTDYRQNHRRRR